MNEEKHWKMPDWIRMNMISKEGAFTMAKVFITLTGTNHYDDKGHKTLSLIHISREKIVIFELKK